MKLRTLIVAAGATLLIVVPSTNAAALKTVHHHFARAALGGLKGPTGKTSKRLVTPRAVYVAPFQPIVTPRYIYFPTPATTILAAIPGADDCLTSGNNCTGRQLCDIYGMNCPAVEAQAHAADSADRNSSTSASA